LSLSCFRGLSHRVRLHEQKDLGDVLGTHNAGALNWNVAPPQPPRGAG